MLRSIGFILVAGLAVSNAHAVLTAAFVPVDNSAGGTDLLNYVTQDLEVTTTTGDDWGTAQLLVSIDNPIPGAEEPSLIYQDVNGGNFAPNPALFGNRLHVFEAHGVRRVADPANEGTEETQVELVPRSQLPRLVREGAITHALVVAAFHWLALAEG